MQAAQPFLLASYTYCLAAHAFLQHINL